jgi:hypothetical protein
MPFTHTGFSFLRAGMACIAILVATAATAAADGFSAGLLPDERAASGIATLTPAQAATLDSLVKRDVDLAHQGAVTGFSSAFTERCTPKERTAAGIDLLPAKDRAVLDSLVARAIAAGPAPGQAISYAPQPAAVSSATTVSRPPGIDVHGDLSFSIGAGSHGSSFYGTSADVFATDPSGKFTLGVGFSEYRGHGLLPLCDPALLGPPVGGW